MHRSGQGVTRRHRADEPEDSDDDGEWEEDERPRILVEGLSELALGEVSESRRHAAEEAGLSRRATKLTGVERERVSWTMGLNDERCERENGKCAEAKDQTLNAMWGRIG